MTLEKGIVKTPKSVYGNRSMQIPIKTLQSNTEMTCDACSSTDIVETLDGYTCRDCGIVLEIQKLEYHRPYNEDIIQHAVIGTTQIGTKRERMRLPISARLEKLNKLHSIKENKETILNKARIEISRTFTALNLPETQKETVFQRFQRFRNALSPGTKYRSVEKLVPITIYYSFKTQNMSINESELLEVSKITKREFNAFKLRIQSFEPQYAARKRKDYIIQKILEVSEHFDLGMPFYYQSKKILYKLWETLKCTTDDVVAGVVSSISVLCSFSGKINVNAICKRLGIKMSTIQSQVKRKIMVRANGAEFVSLVKSADLLRTVMEKWGLVELEQVQEDKTEEVMEAPEIIFVEFGNAEPVFNSHEDIEYYCYVIKDIQGNPVIISTTITNSVKALTEITQRRAEKQEYHGDILLEFECFHIKGPPLIV